MPNPIAAQAKPAPIAQPKRQPPYHVILLDDNEHSYQYVIQMLRRLFGYSFEKSFQMAREVDTTGQVIVDTTTLERAELKQLQIHGFGADKLILSSSGAMAAKVEPAVDA